MAAFSKSLTDIAEFAFETAAADAFAAGALAVTVAVGNLALVVFQTAFFALPARVALALAVDVIASSTAQHRTHACTQSFTTHSLSLCISQEILIQVISFTNNT